MLYDDTGLLQDFSKLDSLCKSHHTLFASDTLEFKSLCITLKHQKGESRLEKKKKFNVNRNQNGRKNKLTMI